MEDKKRVAFYGRVSTLHEEQMNAFDNQQLSYKDLLEAHSSEWELYKYYSDEGKSGTTSKRRKDFSRMLEDAEEHKFDLIVTREVSRFARNTVDLLNTTRRLKELGIGVLFLNNGIDTRTEKGESRLTMWAMFAQEESENISDRVKSGQKMSFKKGVPYGNGNILGYTRIEKEKNNVEFIIAPEQAETVKLIFDLYLSGLGVRKIQYELEKLGRKTATGLTRWRAETISHILQNPFYCGKIVYRKSYVVDCLTHKRVKNPDVDKSDSVKGKHEPIISEADFDAVQEIFKKRRYGVAGNQVSMKPVKSIWSHKLECQWGSPFLRGKWRTDSKGITRYGYQCSHQQHTGTVSAREKRGISTEGICTVPMIQEWKLSLMASMLFQMIWEERDSILKVANELLNENIVNSTMVDKQSIEQEKKLRRQKNSLDNQLSALVDLYTSGDITKEVFLSKKKEYSEKLDNIQNKLNETSKAFMDAENKTLESRIKSLESLLKQKLNFDPYDVPEDIIDAIVAKVVVHDDSFEWHLNVKDCIKDVIKCNANGRRNNASSNLMDFFPDKSKQHRLL